jgi:hypothetical protein
MNRDIWVRQKQEEIKEHRITKTMNILKPSRTRGVCVQIAQNRKRFSRSSMENHLRGQYLGMHINIYLIHISGDLQSLCGLQCLVAMNVLVVGAETILNYQKSEVSRGERQIHPSLILSNSKHGGG